MRTGVGEAEPHGEDGDGQHDPAEMIASVQRGLYAPNFGGGQVDITSGKFVFSASEAYEIEGVAHIDLVQALLTVVDADANDAGAASFAEALAKAGPVWAPRRARRTGANEEK